MTERTSIITEETAQALRDFFKQQAEARGIDNLLELQTMVEVLSQAPPTQLTKPHLKQGLDNAVNVIHRNLLRLDVEDVARAVKEQKSNRTEGTVTYVGKFFKQEITPSEAGRLKEQFGKDIEAAYRRVYKKTPMEEGRFR